METIKVKTHVGKDGILTLKLPNGTSDVDCEVTITIEHKTSRELWLTLINETAGSLADDPVERLPQGRSDIRDEII